MCHKYSIYQYKWSGSVSGMTYLAMVCRYTEYLCVILSVSSLGSLIQLASLGYVA